MSIVRIVELNFRGCVFVEDLILKIILDFLPILISIIFFGFSAIILSRFVPWYWDYMHGMTERNFIMYLLKGRY